MKKWIIVVLILALGVGGYYGFTLWQKTNSSASGPSRSTTAPAEVRDINFAVNAAGEIAPAEQVSVRPEINGKIEILSVDVGDRVKKGDLLFKLDDSELQQQRASNLTDIERAKLAVEKAERDYKRAQQLLAEKLISQELFDDTKTAFDLARNGAERAQKDLAITEERLTKTEVKAPFDCTVLTRPVSIGQAISGSGGFNSGTEVLTIADLTSMIINAQVNQADVPRLKPGESVEVTVEAVSGLQILGQVERISPQATIKNNIKGYPARIILKDVDPRVRPGMTANVKIPVATADHVTAVPLSAVFTERIPDTPQMERFVYVQEGAAFNKRSVKVGISDFFYAEIQEGLSPGEIVALELPKDELEKMSRQRSGGESNAPGHKAGSILAGTRTNSTAPGTASASSENQPKPTPVAAPAAVRPQGDGRKS